MPKYQVWFFDNGNISVTDGENQVIELQKESTVSLFIKFIESLGYNPLDFELYLPAGKAKLFRTERGWNWSFNDFLVFIGDNLQCQKK